MALCIHCARAPGEGRHDFRPKDWIWDERDKQAYGIPFRCLYSANLDNLMMAGKHISFTHVAGSTTLMGKGAQHGIAVAAATFLCKKHGTTPPGAVRKPPWRTQKSREQARLRPLALSKAVHERITNWPRGNEWHTGTSCAY
jgi:hypothetical protein